MYLSLFRCFVYIFEMTRTSVERLDHVVGFNMEFDWLKNKDGILQVDKIVSMCFDRENKTF